MTVEEKVVLTKQYINRVEDQDAQMAMSIILSIFEDDKFAEKFFALQKKN